MAEFEHQKYPELYGNLYQFYMDKGWYGFAARRVIRSSSNPDDVQAVDELLKAAPHTTEWTKQRLAIKARRRVISRTSEVANTFNLMGIAVLPGQGPDNEDFQMEERLRGEIQTLNQQIQDIRDGRLAPWK